MPRIAREKSKSGLYHVIIRGANRQEIFHDEENIKYKKYIMILAINRTVPVITL